MITPTTENITASGEWWTLYENGILRISVDGEMPVSEESPWRTYYENIQIIEIENDATEISAYTFKDCIRAICVKIPASVTSIEISAFDNCIALKDVYYSGTESRWNDIYIAEDGNTSLSTASIHYNSDIPYEDFYTVTFDSNGGSAIPANVVKSGETVRVPASPNREDDEFISWLLNGTDYDFSTPVTEDITLVAHWKSDSDSGGETGSVTRTMREVALEIASAMGVEIDSRTALNDDYRMTNPKGYTAREILQAIAGANGGNWIITTTGKLRLVPLFGNSTTYDVGYDALSFIKNRKTKPISQVIVNTESGSFTSGGGDENTLAFDCPFVDETTAQQIANDVYNKIGGYRYQGFSAEAARISPTAALGANVSVGGIRTMLVKQEITLSPGCFSDISAPGEQDVNHEFTYKSPAVSAIERQEQAESDLAADLDEKITNIYNTIEQTDNSIRTYVENQVTDLHTEIVQLPNKITLSVNNDEDGKSVSITLYDDGEPTSTAKIILHGDTYIDSRLTAETLYSALGDIADLVVDRLSTSRRIPKYLAENTSDDNYIHIEGQNIEWRAGIYNANGGPGGDGKEQARNPYGSLIYWETDPNGEGAFIGENGYPYRYSEDAGQNVPISIVTEETDWPVMVYTYTEQIKASFNHELETNDADGNPIYTPTIILGAGNEAGTNQARIRKSTDGLEIMYKPNNHSDGTPRDEIGIKMNNNGEMEIIGYDFIRKIASEADLPDDWENINRIYVTEEED